MKTWRLAIGLCVILAALVGGMAYFFVPSAEACGVPPLSGDLDQKREQSLWDRKIADCGATEAYGLFKEYVSSLDFQQQHELAHSFGAALYARSGVEGIAVCDDRYSYGCFHEVAGQYLPRNGMGSLPTLTDICAKKDAPRAINCMHGVGHGILASLGYERSEMDSSLEACATSGNLSKGCFGGVFMEYNVQSMLGTDAHLREASAQVNEPCDTVPAEAQDVCYFWQPQWWQQILIGQGEELERRFVEIGKRCEALRDEENKRACFEGTGPIAAAAVRFDPLSAAALCDAAGSVPQQRLYCRAYVAGALYTADGDDSRAKVACAGLPHDLIVTCERYSKARTNGLGPGAI